MTSSPPAELIGRQEPRVYSIPDSACDFDSGLDALDVADIAGRVSFPWQQSVVKSGMAKKIDGAWAAFEVGVLVSRQNGKNGCIEVVELGWMISEPGVSILHTAHEFQTALESMDKLEALIRSHPLLEDEIASVRRGNGKESIRMKNGSVIRFRTRTKSGGRGFSVDRLIIDEAMICSPASMAAIMPLLTTAKRPQIWYLGSAADADTHEYCHKWASLRERALDGTDPTLCWMEWSAPDLHDGASNAERVYWRESRENWAFSNPSLGYLLTEEYIENELAAFRREVDRWEIERLSAGRWPVDESVESEHVVDMEQWSDMADPRPVLAGPIALAIDMTPDRKWCSIAAAQRTSAGKVHIEVGFHEAPVTDEIVPMVLRLIERWEPCALVIDKQSPAMTLVNPLLDAGVEAETTVTNEYVQACGNFYDDAVNEKLSHTGDPLLHGAIEAAEWRDLSGGRAWNRRGKTPISPLVAATLAHYGLLTFGGRVVVPPASPAVDDAVDEAEEFDIMAAF